MNSMDSSVIPNCFSLSSSSSSFSSSLSLWLGALGSYEVCLCNLVDSMSGCDSDTLRIMSCFDREENLLRSFHWARISKNPMLAAGALIFCLQISKTVWDLFTGTFYKEIWCLPLVHILKTACENQFQVCKLSVHIQLSAYFHPSLSSHLFMKTGLTFPY